MLNWSTKQALLKLFPLIISVSFAMDVYVPAIPEMGTYFHASSAYMQASLYLFMFTMAISQLAIGPLANIFGRRFMAMTASLLFLLGSVLCAHSSSLPLLMVGRIIQAMGACGTYLICFIIIRDNFQTKACARLFSLLGGINSIIASLAPIIGGVLLDLTHNWRSGFYFLTFLGLMIVLACYSNIPHYATVNPCLYKVHKQHQWRIILTNPSFQKYTIIACSGLLGLYLFCALSPEILIKTLHTSSTHYGLWFGLNALTVFLANLIAARLTNSLALSSIVRSGVLIMVCASILMVSLNIFSCSVLSFMIPMLGMTIGIGLSMGCSIALALRDLEAISGLATSIVSACQFGVSACIGALIAQTSLTPLHIALPVLLLSLFGLVKSTNKKRLVDTPTMG